MDVSIVVPSIILKAAGHRELQAACDKIGHCSTGSAVITPGFGLRAKYVTHAVGPVWKGGNHGEDKLLYGAYRRSLELAVEHGCASIGFPLISAGIFGCPVPLAWKKALQACADFLSKGHDLRIVFAVLGDDVLQEGMKARKHVVPVVGETADPSTTQEKLLVAGQEADAVYFHLPSEPHGYLSNWYASDFDLDGIRYTSTEQYIMHAKCVLFGDHASAAAVLATDDPEKQQAIGKQASGFVDKVWEGMRQLVAIRGLMAKFTQNDGLRQELLATGDAWLVECAYSDITWACGRRLHEDERRDVSTWRGQNILGFALMEVRAALRAAE